MSNIVLQNVILKAMLLIGNTTKFIENVDNYSLKINNKINRKMNKRMLKNNTKILGRRPRKSRGYKQY